MVCPRLNNGKCKTTRKTCKARYMTKMKHHKNCKNYKTGKPAKNKIKRKIKKKKR